MNKDKFFQNIVLNQQNISFNDFCSIVTVFGFKKKRTSGSHVIFKRDGIKEMLNIQNYNGEAKPYQIKQFLAIVEKHNIKMEGK